ncbi:hypothetical protein FRB99_001186 [Tulasnella sp. 403]|nr:hypothetical protein FRB99_001186 [Tulasnella sp. 403]
MATPKKEFAYFTMYDRYNEMMTRVLELNRDPKYAFITSDDPVWEEERILVWKISGILDGHQEQSYVLDPFLERMVLPPIQRFRERATEVIRGQTKAPNRPWVPMLVYHLIKTRGSKIVVRFFPHEVGDLDIALQYLATEDTTPVASWQARYVTLLWLSLVVRLPFDLAKFDKDDHGAAGSTFAAIEKAAKDNLSRAGTEREAASLLLAKLFSRTDAVKDLFPFLEWASASLRQASDPFLAIGVLHTLCEMSRDGGSLKHGEQEAMHTFLHLVWSMDTLMSNTHVRKWSVKLTSRLALSVLPFRTATVTRKRLMGELVTIGPATDEDIEVPETVEAAIAELLSSVQDRDTIVRWSAAKGIARVAERLPADYANQILESILSLYSIHSLDNEDEVPAAAEGTWHGATLASAEMARRGLVSKQNLPTLLDWLKKGLYFDIRKGAHSIGSNVRDAVAYVLWALARAQDKESFRPYAPDVARRLVTVALFDREVHVRRAASAAFQEHVGRMGLFPHGIAILANMDFFAVSVRRNAFTVCAPQVAEHDEYRDVLIDHLLTITLKHWDSSMRQSSAEALRRICTINLATFGPECVTRAVRLVRSVDSNDVHGGLLTLAELAAAYKESGDSSLEPFHLQAPDLKFAKANIVVQQCTARTLGAIAYGKYPQSAVKAINCLLSAVDPESASFSNNVEARQSAYKSLPKILQELGPILPDVIDASLSQQIYQCLIQGLADYTTDRRGDVGSWLRMACIQGLTDIALLYFDRAEKLRPFEQWLPSSLYEKAVSGMLKQAAERLDNVRLVATNQLIRLVEYGAPSFPGGDQWRLQGEDIMRRELIEGADELKSWGEGNWLFPKIAHLLAIPTYRPDLIMGLVLSIGSRNEGAVHPAATSLIKYMLSLEPDALVATINSILDIAKTHVIANNIFVPVLQTFDALIDGGVAAQLGNTEDGIECLKAIIAIATKNIDRVKSVPRIMASGKIVAGLLGVPQVGETAVKNIEPFLGHKFPKVRSTMAETLYLVLQGVDIEVDEEVEEALLQTNWTADVPEIQDAIDSIATKLAEALRQ